jgi:hypothetical protein
MAEEVKVVPEEFAKVIKDFIGDIKTTFPEYVPLINKWWKDETHFQNIEDEQERNEVYQKAEKKNIKKLFDFCQKKFPPRFFEILYQNDEMFKEESELDTEFLPNIHFKNLWQFDISDKTREIIWKYLQLIMFSILGSIDGKEAFGDTAKLFEAINEDDFKTKLEETLSQMQGLFDSSGNEGAEGPENLGKGFNMEDMPNANDIHEHISGMLDGKLGKLAREIAEETAEGLNIDMENVTDMKGVFNNLIKNPTKLMGLVKNVGDKLDSRIKSGEIKESELIAEATEIMNRMKNMPGMGDIQSMLGKMGLGGMGGLGGLGGKVNMKATEANLNKAMKMAKTKERIRAKAEANQAARLAALHAANNAAPAPKPAMSEEELVKIFSTGETVERTPRSSNKQESSQTQNSSNKKKKGKK